MNKVLAKKLVDMKRKQATEMAGKRLDIQVSGKAIDINEKERTATFVMSTQQIDRHQEIVDQKSMNFKNFLENPYFAWQHKTNDFPLGRWNKVWQEADPEMPGELRTLGTAYYAVEIEDNGETYIDEHARRAWLHTKDGNIRMVSIGFIPRRVEYNEEKDVFVLFDCELIECSLVGIGSNRGALLTGKSVDTPEEDTNAPDEAETEATEEVVEDEKSIDKKIEEVRDNMNDIANHEKAVNHFKAREYLNKALRRIK